jgi:predicted P-loop ATPase
MQTLYDYPVPYCPVLIGEQGNGKTYWVRNIMPDALAAYYVEKHLSLSPDDKLAMCEAFIIFNDEFGGSMIKETSAFKHLLSSTKFNLRRAYGRFNEEYKRISSMIGASNEDSILFDYTGNRRIFPIPIQGKINFQLYNSIDKVKLWGQVYNMWINKGWPVEMTADHMDMLKGKFDEHYENNTYETIIEELLEEPESENDFVSTFDLQTIVQNYMKGQVNAVMIGRAIAKLGFKKMTKRVDFKLKRGFNCKIRNIGNVQLPNF